MGVLQPGLPSPAMIPKGYNIIATDLQDCFFFSTPLATVDRKRFAFSFLSVNLEQPYRHFHWKILPQGIKNSPTLCQKIVDLALTKVRLTYPDIYLVHYMDDNLLAHPDRAFLQNVLQTTVSQLTSFDLSVAPEKI